ncbi:MAG: NADP-dependent oxidoreductase [Deltaproteobacteria bacterium]|nr:NADP-dependent oxidoreductase [Deltaproteobacteria bacterium]
MRAIVAERYGGLDALALVDRPEPEPGPADVRIAVKAASLNPLDFKIREGKLKLVLDLKPPIALGCDVAGVVDAVGANAKRFRAGDEVYVRLEKNRMGGLADKVCADEAVVAAKPAKATFEEAAAIPLAALTSLQALREAAGLTKGQRVLIHAGAGGVGSLAIQLGKILGLHVATTTSTKNVGFCRELGADEVIDYTKHEPLPTELDAVFDTLGGDSELASIAACRRGGVVVGVGGMPDGAFAKARLPAFARPVVWLATRKRRNAARAAGVRFTYLFMRPDGAELAELASWIDAGTLKPIVHRTFPLADFRDAFAELERGRARGKIVLSM